jgi:hypothetical protein
MDISHTFELDTSYLGTDTGFKFIINAEISVTPYRDEYGTILHKKEIEKVWVDAGRTELNEDVTFHCQPCPFYNFVNMKVKTLSLADLNIKEQDLEDELVEKEEDERSAESGVD